jgi:hypothetical protein
MPKHNSSRASKSKPSGKGKKEETPACRKSREKNAELVLEILKNGMFTTYPRLPVVFGRVTDVKHDDQRKLLLSTGETCMGTLRGSVSHGGWFPSGVGNIVLVEYNADAFSKLSYRTDDTVWLDIIAVPSEGDIEYVIKRSYSHFLPDWLLHSDDPTEHCGGGSFFDYSGDGAGGGATGGGIGAVDEDMYAPSMGTKADKARRELQKLQSVLANVVQAPQGNRGTHSNTGGGAGFREKDDEAEEIADIFKSVKLTAEHHREEAAKKAQKNAEKVKKMLEDPDGVEKPDAPEGGEKPDTPEGGEKPDTPEGGEEDEEEEEP